MKILFADSLPESHIGKVRAAGHECVLMPDLTAEDLPDHVAGVDVLTVRSTRVTEATIKASDRLSMIIRAGAGTNTIDKTAAADRGIYVCNVPGRNAVAVAELAMGLLLAVDRRIADNVADLRSGVWKKSEYSRAAGLYGRTMGVIGLGSIGLALAERAKAFGMTVLGIRRPGRSPASESRIRSVGIRLVDDVEALLHRADVVSLHVPAGDSTHHMVDADFLAAMKDGAILINTSRGEIVDEGALLAELDSGRLRAGLDVYESEPTTGRAEFDSPLASHPNVVGTHHIGASTAQAQSAIADGVIELIGAYERGEIIDCVNMETLPAGSATVTVRHYNRVGVLARVLQVLREEKLNVEQMENHIFAGSTAAAATLEVVGNVPPDLTGRIDALPDVIASTVNAREDR